MVSETIRRAVVKKIKSSGRSLRQTAASVGIDPAHLSRFLNGKAAVSTAVLDDLAKWAGVKAVIR